MVLLKDILLRLSMGGLLRFCFANFVEFMDFFSFSSP
jgi:hypothetical protein